MEQQIGLVEEGLARREEDGSPVGESSLTGSAKHNPLWQSSARSPKGRIFRFTKTGRGRADAYRDCF
jgi:hypothetical protein